MEASSFHLVACEILISVCGFLFYLWRVVKVGIYRAELYILVLAMVSPLWFLGGDSFSRLVGLKATIFLGVLIASLRWPKIMLSILAFLAISGFLLDGLQTGEFISKNVGLNSNRILAIPFGLIGAIVLILFDKRRFRVQVAFILLVLDLLLSLEIGIRAGILSAIFAGLILSSQLLSKLFVRSAVFLPFIYITLVFTSYILLSEGTSLLEYTPSNFERSSMIYASLVHFFDYIVTGPQVGFDLLAQGYLNSFDWIAYESEKGVDPHMFLLSFWRDEGALLTLAWVVAWVFYWRRLQSYLPAQLNVDMRLMLGLLATSVVHFSLAPPSVGERLLVAIVMGASLGLFKQKKINSAQEVFGERAPRMKQRVVMQRFR